MTDTKRIPTAEEMQQNGIDIVEKQIKLLQKAKELNLYLIELKKEKEKIMEENNKMKKEIENLKSK